MLKDTISVVTPRLEQKHTCLKHSPHSQRSEKSFSKMKKTKTPRWFYSSGHIEHKTKDSKSSQLRIELPVIHNNPIREELEKLERVQDWLRQSYKSPVGLVDAQHGIKSIDKNHRNKSTLDDVPLQTKSTEFDNDTSHLEDYKFYSNFQKPKLQKANSHTELNSIGHQAGDSNVQLQLKENLNASVANDYDGRNHYHLPQLPVFRSLTSDPVIIGSGVQYSSKHTGNHYHKNNGNYEPSEYSSSFESSSRHPNHPKSLPTDATVDEYLNRRTKTYYGMNRSFSDLYRTQQVLRKGVGPIQRPHDNYAGDVLLRQRTRYGDTMMHAKSSSHDYIDQKGRTYKLHTQLKNMLLEK